MKKYEFQIELIICGFNQQLVYGCEDCEWMDRKFLYAVSGVLLLIGMAIFSVLSKMALVLGSGKSQYILSLHSRHSGNWCFGDKLTVPYRAKYNNNANCYFIVS